MKLWTYADITSAAEEFIKYNMDEAEKKVGGYASIHRDFASGAYLLWCRLTSGWQNEGDDERIESLIKREKQK